MAQSEAQDDLHVIIIRDSGAVRGSLRDSTRKPVVVDETGETVQWEIFAYAESLPLVFQTRETALEWVRTNACAKYFDMEFLTNPQVNERDVSTSVEKGQS